MDQILEASETVLTWRYAAVVFAAVLGAIQVASAHAGLRGLLFMPWHARVCFWPSRYYQTLTPLHFSYFFAIVTIAPSLMYLFMWNEYNEIGIISGSEQAGLFVLCTLLAGVFSLLLSSLTNHWRLRHNQTQSHGLEALKEITWFQSFCRHWVRKKE